MNSKRLAALPCTEKKNVYTKKILFDWSKPFIGHRTNGIYVYFKEMNAFKARKYFFPNKKIFLKS